jgi:hypothetical protein
MKPVSVRDALEYFPRRETLSLPLIRFSISGDITNSNERSITSLEGDEIDFDLGFLLPPRLVEGGSTLLMP